MNPAPDNMHGILMICQNVTLSEIISNQHFALQNKKVIAPLNLRKSFFFFFINCWSLRNILLSINSQNKFQLIINFCSDIYTDLKLCKELTFIIQGHKQIVITWIQI